MGKDFQYCSLVPSVLLIILWLDVFDHYNKKKLFFLVYLSIVNVFINKTKMKKNIQLTESELHNIIRRTLFSILSRVNYKDRNYDITDRQEIINYSSTIWSILQNSYKELGGFKSYNSKNEMAQTISLLTICVIKHRIVACAIYRDDLGGQKLNGCGTLNGSNEQKKLLRNLIRDDIDNLQKYHWVEVSYPLEKWFKEFNGNPIPSTMVAKLLHKSKIHELEDGVHYQREIGVNHEIVTKAIYGFKDENTYNKVMNNLEKYAGFTNYKSFKNHINSLPRIVEEIDYKDNNTDETIALAMEIVIQIGNLWEDGYRELSPNMMRYLKNAVDILKQYEEKNQQINGLIRTGTYYLQNMEVILCHTSIPNEIYAPAF